MAAESHALLTGSSGFLGRYLVRGLESDGYTLTTLGRNPSNDLVCDLSSAIPDLNQGPHPRLVVHAAGKAHATPKNKEEEREFFRVNDRGAENLLQGLERSKRLPKALVFISTVAVYGRDTGEQIDETHALEAVSAYGVSKICAEVRLKKWGLRHGVRICILRLPLVAGHCPPGNLGAMIRAIEKGYYARLGQGAARRSWVWAEDVAAIIGAAALTGGVYNLTDGQDPTFREIEDGLALLAGKEIRFKIPMAPARILAKSGDALKAIGLKKFPFDTHRLSKMTEHLTFSSARARKKLAWDPTPVLSNLARVLVAGTDGST